MSEATPAVKATKVKILTDAHVEADVSRALRYIPSREVERLAKAMEDACQEFHSHCRDHRSLDWVSLSVVRVFTDCCSACKRELETVCDPDLNEGRKSCASCGTEMEV